MDEFTKLQQESANLLEKQKQMMDTISQEKKQAAETLATLKAMKSKMEAEADKLANKIVLDVGGTRFATTKATLLSHKDSYFSAMLTSGKWQPQADGSYFMDCDPDSFKIILTYLRTGVWNVEGLNVGQLQVLQHEADYLQIKPPEQVSPEPAIVSSSPSSALLNEENRGVRIINSWLPSGKKIGALLYQATKDGFQAASFHNKCDNQGPTVVVIQSTQGWIFGGYASVSWNSLNEGYIHAPGSFLFTLTNCYAVPPTKFNLKPDNESNALIGSFHYGPTFGYSDLYISNNANIANSTTSFPCTYQDTTGRGNFLFTGSTYFFMTKEMEVFKVESTK